jgi:hypothetical protein
MKLQAYQWSTSGMKAYDRDQFGVTQFYKADEVERYIDSMDKVAQGKRDLVRELDVLLNGKGAAQQASLIDLIAQVRREGIRSHGYTP